MTSSTKLSTLALIALLGVTACDNDESEPQPATDEPAMEQPAPGQQAPAQEMDPETMELMMEAQELQQRLVAIQDEAMQDEELAGQLDEIRDRVEVAMREEAPELLDRMDQFETDFMAAQEAGDQEAIQRIGMEAQETEMELQAIQQEVLTRPEISDSIESFEVAQRERMIEIDPEAGEILDRLEEIRAEMGMS